MQFGIFLNKKQINHHRWITNPLIVDIVVLTKKCIPKEDIVGIFIERLRSVAKDENLKGWTITPSTDYYDREILLIFPKYTYDMGNKDLIGKKILSVQEVEDEISKYKEIDIDNYGKITVYKYKG